MKKTPTETESGKKQTAYQLVHRITRKPIYSGPQPFRSMTAATLFALQHDLHADIVPSTVDLFGDANPE
jgi:hypothetical protein